MSKRDVNSAVEAFLNNGGEVVRLKAATVKDVRKSSHKFSQRDRAISGSENSKTFIQREDKKEESFIFSRTERWSK
jgi:hypothetical protein